MAVNPCLGLDEGAVLEGSDFGDCTYANPCDQTGVKTRTQTVCVNGMPTEQTEESADNCERDTEGVRIETGEYGECQYMDECIVAGKKPVLSQCAAGAKLSKKWRRP